MVALSKIHSACKTASYIAFFVLSACTSDYPQTVIKLHFKQPDAIIEALKANFEQDIDFHVVDNSIVFNAPEKDIKKTLSLLEILDQPPSIYTLHLSSKAVRSYSTQPSPNFLDLIEGNTTSMPLKGLQHEFNITRIGESRSILNIRTLKKQREISNHHLLLVHGKWKHTAELALSKKIKIDLIK